MGAGRRTKLTAELQKRICAFIRTGAYDYAAAEACGINRRTFFDWLQAVKALPDAGSRRDMFNLCTQFAQPRPSAV
jgi:hypothetical protein